MTKNYFLLAIIAMLLLFTACSESDKSTSTTVEYEAILADSADFVFEIPADLTGFTSQDVDYVGATVTGYPLAQFIPIDQITPSHDPDVIGDVRDFYQYEIVSSDADGNYSPRNSSNNLIGDLTFTQFSSGYLLPSEDGRTYFPSAEIVGAFRVKKATYIKLYYKVDVKKADGEIIPIEVRAFTASLLEYLDSDGNNDQDNAFAAVNFITDYITTEKDNYEYSLVLEDGYVDDETNNLYNWTKMQQAYFLPDKKSRIIFIDESGAQIHNPMKYVIRIELVEIAQGK